MAYHKTYDLPEPVTSTACIHLHNKAMHVLGDRSGLDHTDSGHCWCALTQSDRGPDQGYATRPDCIAGRKCYRESC